MKFRIVGTTVPAIEVFFEQAGEEMITQSGGMAWMSDGISMTSDTNGGVLAGLGRMFAGESLFMARYKALRSGTTIAFASTVPGSIIPIKMRDCPNGLICQKGSFLCSQSSVNLEVTFSKKFSSGLFGGEGFILEKLSGAGTAFLEVDGDAVEKELQPGEVIKVDTGNVVAFQNGMSYEIEAVHGFKNILFGGEGLFLTRITGPGRVILQTQNIKDFAGILSRYIPNGNR
ncbi:MAG: TIGR00266 family protein [Lachnospiraceae bacterium]|nr:TIGR00266 family protein [Lachnospiraceae bacterium]